MLRSSPWLSVVIPVYNERASLDELARRCLHACDAVGAPYELILVDDGSGDGSREAIEQLAAEHAAITGILLNRNYGQHAAVMAGLAHAGGEAVITLDADLQNPPEEIPRLAAKIREGFDVVGTVRAHREDSLFRRLASNLTNRAVRLATGVLMHDYGCMLRAYRRPVVDAILKCRETSTFVPVLANSFARRTTEIDVEHCERASGTSKYGLYKLVKLQFDLLTSMTTFPLRLLSILGGISALLGFAFSALLLVLRLALGPRWAADGVFTVFAVLFGFVGAQLLAMGLLGEYIGRIYLDVRGRPRYYVERVVAGGSETEMASDEGGSAGVSQRRV
ncbi:MAG: glycosyltransferase [Candidatus Schekmanbacteria bacterium]|nr:glycosyltransferase [Candidatus Schekmanbacteria bacterium]